MPKKNSQAHQQAPWRIQLQRIGIFLLAVVVISLVASVYLYFSAQIADVGVEIWRIEETREAAYYDIENLQTELAKETAVSKMQERAKEMGFVRYSPQEVEYMVIKGYYGKQPAIIGDTTPAEITPDAIIKPVYTQSLWEWLLENLLKMGSK
ncbi:MAG: hypothetical protein RBT34_02025 [Anaerolineaceae bacterium]|jgi:cell division protein FtsL|nr:hypothetical protein [Anaerolineaceae bacterium]